MKSEIKRYLVIPSALLAISFAKVSCADNKVRNGYNSKEDCLKDHKPADCEEDTTFRHGGSSSHFWGPWYSASSNRSFSNNASGVVNQSGDFMPANKARGTSPSAFADFSKSGSGSTTKAAGTSYSRGGFGSTARSFSSSSSGG